MKIAFNIVSTGINDKLIACEVLEKRFYPKFKKIVNISDDLILNIKTKGNAYKDIPEDIIEALELAIEDLKRDYDVVIEPLPI